MRGGVDRNFFQTFDFGVWFISCIFITIYHITIIWTNNSPKTFTSPMKTNSPSFNNYTASSKPAQPSPMSTNHNTSMTPHKKYNMCTRPIIPTSLRELPLKSSHKNNKTTYCNTIKAHNVNKMKGTTIDISMMIWHVQSVLNSDMIK